MLLAYTLTVTAVVNVAYDYFVMYSQRIHVYIYLLLPLNIPLYNYVTLYECSLVLF